MIASTPVGGQALETGGALDFSSWYAGTAFLPILAVALIAIYGFRTSLGEKGDTRNFSSRAIS